MSSVCVCFCVRYEGEKELIDVCGKERYNGGGERICECSGER